MTANPTPRCRGGIELEERLIEAVRKRRPLWDNSTPLHKNVNVLMYCWQQVAQEFGMEELLIKRKWKSLREYFFKQVKELKKKGVDVRIDGGGVNYCAWPLYNQLTFLMANKKGNNNLHGYKMNAEEQELLEKVSEYQKLKKSGLETIIYHVPSSETEDVVLENSSKSSPILSIENELEQEITDQSKQCQAPLMKVIKPTSKTLQEKDIIQPGTTNKVTLCDPPPLRVFKQAPNTKETESLQTKLRSEQCQPPPFKKFKPIQKKNDSRQSETTNDTESDADLHFFKSLLPFMRAIPLQDKLRVRNGIQDLILGELDALRNNDSLFAVDSRARSDICNDPLSTQSDDAGFDQEYHPNRTIIVKEEFEDDQTLLIEIDSKNFTYEEDDNYGGD